MQPVTGPTTDAARSDATLALLRETCARGWAPTRDGGRWPFYATAGVDPGAAQGIRTNTRTTAKVHAEDAA